MPANLRTSFLDDYKIVDNVETITLTTLPAGTATTVTKVAREALTEQEVAASGGTFQSGDVAFNLASPQLVSATFPKQGDRITDAGGVVWYIVANVTSDEFQLNYRCVARRAR
jgi:hypothetical protein